MQSRHDPRAASRRARHAVVWAALLGVGCGPSTFEGGGASQTGDTSGATGRGETSSGDATATSGDPPATAGGADSTGEDPPRPGTTTEDPGPTCVPTAASCETLPCCGDDICIDYASGPVCEPDEPGCFAAGTLVATPHGERAIETLRVGDAVYAYDVDQDRRVESRIVATIAHPPTPVLHLTVGEATLRVTDNHPIYDPTTGDYVRAGRLATGQPLLTWGGDDARSRMVAAWSGGEAVPVYNLTVAGEHNYFADGVLVHNKFIIDPDGSAVDSECDLWAQDCPEGEKCMPWANDGEGVWNGTRCSPLADNPGQVGDECTVEGSGVSGIDDCALATMCWDVDAETNMGTCVAMCTGSEDVPICEDPETFCAIDNDGAIVLCLPDCNPLLQACGEGLGCYPLGDAFVCVQDASGKAGAPGDDCAALGSCAAGNVCLAAESLPECDAPFGCCSPVCDHTDATADADCMAFDAGTTCEPWYRDGGAPDGFESVGVCTVAR